MSIGAPGGLPRGRPLEALRHKLKHRCDLLPRHVELFHDFFDAQIFKILDDCGNRQPGVLKNPRAADLAGDALHGGALRPIEIRYSGASFLQNSA